MLTCYRVINKSKYYIIINIISNLKTLQNRTQNLHDTHATIYQFFTLFNIKNLYIFGHEQNREQLKQSDFFKKKYCTIQDFLIHPGSKYLCSTVLEVVTFCLCSYTTPTHRIYHIKVMLKIHFLLHCPHDFNE